MTTTCAHESLTDSLSPPEFTVDILAIARITLPALAWANLAFSLLPYHDPSLYGFALGMAFFLASSCMMVGFYSRTSSLVFGLIVLVWLRMVEGNLFANLEFRHHQNTLLGLVICLLAFTNCGRTFSIDRWWRRKRQSVKASPALAYGEFNLLMCGLLSSVYLYAAIDKLSAGSRSGLRLYFWAARLYFGSTAAQPWQLPAMCLLTWIAILLEFAFAIVIWHPVGARRAMPFAIAFHLILYFTLPVSVFSLLMILLWSLRVYCPRSIPEQRVAVTK